MLLLGYARVLYAILSPEERETVCTMALYLAGVMAMDGTSTDDLTTLAVVILSAEGCDEEQSQLLGRISVTMADYLLNG